jgi:hypothetical protein
VLRFLVYHRSRWYPWGLVFLVYHRSRLYLGVLCFLVYHRSRWYPGGLVFSFIAAPATVVATVTIADPISGVLAVEEGERIIDGKAIRTFGEPSRTVA